MSGPVVVLLYVPADRPDRIGRALASGSDGIIVDLEDAVAPSEKEAARGVLATLPNLVRSAFPALPFPELVEGSETISEAGAPFPELVEGSEATTGTGERRLRQAQPTGSVAEQAGLRPFPELVEGSETTTGTGERRLRQAQPARLPAPATAALPVVQVRINAVGTPWHDADVEALAALPTWVGARIPKAERVEDVEALARRLPGRDLHLLIESALGVERAFDLASCPQVASLGLGEADLKADLGVTADGLDWVRGRIVNAARAAGLSSPLMSAFTHVTDLEGLAASCRDGRARGFLGRSAIHPKQIATIRESFRPTDEEVARARTVLDRIEGSVAAGVGALQLADGTFLDLAMVESARRTIALATD